MGKYIKFFRLFLVLMVGVLFLVGSSEEAERVENKITIEGKVYSDLNQSATVNLYLSSDLNESISSTNILNTGSFQIEDIAIDKEKFYIIKTCFSSEKEGCINTIIKGEALSMYPIHIGYLNDMIYTSFNEQFLIKSTGEIEDFLIKKAKDYCREDINNDGKIDYIDILLFEPIEDISKLNINYNLIENMYSVRLQDTITKAEKLKSLLLLDKPQLKFSDGTQITLNDTVNIDIDNLPNGVEFKLFSNQQEITSSYQPSINGIHNIYIKFFFGKEQIGEDSKPIVVSTQTQLGQFDAPTSEDSTLKIDYDTNSDFSGLEIQVPKDSLTDSKLITVKENNISVIASSRGRSLSSVLSLEPSGTTFDKPVQIKIPFSGSLEKSDIEKVEIARYSKDSGLDYIRPSYIDIENKFIYFETDHFSWFSAKGPFTSKSSDEREKEIEYLNNLMGKSWSEDRWKIILEPDNTEEYTLYDYFYELYLSEKIFTKIGNDDYVGAVQVLYPNNDALDDTVERWDNLVSKLKLLEILMEKTVSTPDDEWWKFWTFWSDTGKLYTMMGTAQDNFFDTENIAYTPFAPVEMGSKVFKDFSKLLQNNTLRTAFAMADVDGGWNDVYIKPHINSPDTDNPSNRNVGFVYRKYDEFRKYGDESKQTLKTLIDRRATFIDNMDDPYLKVYVDRVDNQWYQQFGKAIEIQASESIAIDVHVYGLGIANFDETDLKYELIGNYGDSNQFILSQDTTKTNLQFKLPDEVMYQNYVLRITHTPSSVQYEEHGINIQTVKGEFRLQSTSLLSKKALYPDEDITLIFDEDLMVNSEQRDFGWFSDNIENSIYLRNKNTQEKVKLYWGDWHFGTKNCRLSSGTMRGIECDTDFSILKISPEIDNNQYELIIEDTLESASGKILTDGYLFDIAILHPNRFEVHEERLHYNWSYVDLNLKMFNKYETKKVTYRVQTSSGKEATGSLDIGSASHGGPSSRGYGSCETYVWVSPSSGMYKEGVVNYNNLTVTIGNTRVSSINEKVSIELCNEDGECEIKTLNVQLDAITSDHIMYENCANN